MQRVGRIVGRAAGPILKTYCDLRFLGSFGSAHQDRTLRNRGPWKGLDDLELTTLEWVDWFNHRRLLHRNGSVPPAEAGDRHYRQRGSGDQATTRTKQPA